MTIIPVPPTPGDFASFDDYREALDVYLDWVLDPGHQPERLQALIDYYGWH